MLKKLKKHVPNLITSGRIAISPLLIYLLSKGHFLIGFTMAAIAFATDFLDGYLSRKWEATSRAGEVLDPLADRICVLSAVIGLYVAGKAPKTVMLLFLSREVAAVVGYVVLKIFTKGKFKIIKEGKTVAAVVYVMLALAMILNFPQFVFFIMAAFYFLPFYFYLSEAKRL